MLNFADFMASANAQLIHSDLDADGAQRIIVEALAIHDEFSSIFETAPKVWQYESVTSDHIKDHIDYQHVYRNATAANLGVGKKSLRSRCSTSSPKPYVAARTEPEFDWTLHRRFTCTT